MVECHACQTARQAIELGDPGWRERAALELDLCDIGGCDPDLWTFLENQPLLTAEAINQRHKDRALAAMAGDQNVKTLLAESQEQLRRDFVEMLASPNAGRKRTHASRPKPDVRPPSGKQQPATEPDDEWITGDL